MHGSPDSQQPEVKRRRAACARVPAKPDPGRHGLGTLQNHLTSSELADGHLVQLHIDGYPCSLRLELRRVRQGSKIHGPVATAPWQDCQELLTAGSAI